MIQIPLAQIPAQTFYIVLSGQNCTISVYWRQKRLYLDLSVDDVLVCEGAVCQNKVDIVQSSSPYFSGMICFFDLDGDSPPIWDGLHTGLAGRWALIYIDAGESIPKNILAGRNGA